jgi:predicted CXXCH cytochrome family protein
MGIKVPHSAILVAGYLFVMSLPPAYKAVAAGNQNCGCHSAKSEGPYVHKPVMDGECLSCHRPSGQKHPRIKKGAFGLTDNGKSGLCNECHERKDTMKFIHGPIKTGDCLACHDIHQSNNKTQLKAPNAGGQICYMCHKKEQFDRKHPHPPIAEGKCTGCHDPHQSNVKYLLKGDGMQLCILCHNKGMFTGKSVHKPVAQGDCTACHSIHGTQYPHLLKHNYTDEWYIPYKDIKENFAICFACHNDQIAEDSRTDTKTNLRNGMFNIHYIHINKTEKGRACKTCHDPHAAAQPRLISERISGFGKWDIPILFTKTDTGGTCVVGCHKPKSYDRINPVINP